MTSGGTGAVHPPLLPDVHVEEVGKELFFPDTMLEAGINQSETRLPAESQLLQVFADLQKQLEEQRAETIRERKQATLERDRPPVSESAPHSD